MTKTNLFIMNNQEFQISLSLNQLISLPEDIRDSLYVNGKYNVKSEVKNEDFKEFLTFLVDKDKSPVITIENIYDYHLLCEEFDILIDFISKPENEDLYKISLLTIATSNQTKSRSNCEEYIAQNLDFFLENYFDEMYKIPITSLYNIFSHKERKLLNQNKAYEFITKNQETQSLFVLLKTLTFACLSDDKIIDSFNKQIDHCGFMPQRFSDSNHFKDFMIELEPQKKQEMIKMNEEANNACQKLTE